MNLYYAVLGVIAALCVINLVTLAWVHVLQRRLAKADAILKGGKDAQAIEKAAMDQAIRRVEQGLETSAQVLLDEALANMQKDLAAAGSRLRQYVDATGEKVISTQLGRLDQTMEGLNTTLNQSVQAMQTAVDQKRQELEAALQADTGAEKARILAQFDARLSDVVAGYLQEVLGNEVDLGAQSEYLFAQLEAHKAELKAEVGRETGTA